MLSEIVAAGKPVQANRVLALASKLFAWGVSCDHVPTNPAYRLPRPTRETSAERVLSDAETRAIWRAVLADESPLGRILLLVLLTAQRPGEVRAMAWADVDGDWWTVPAAVAKNGRANRVYLTETAMGLARSVEVRRGQPWVFASRTWHREDGPAVSAARVFARIRVRAALAEHWTPHDLRRTAATRLASLGVPREIVRRILNHRDASVTAIYDRHRYDREVREALCALEREVLRIVGEAPAAPVPG
jgi:integrase